MGEILQRFEYVNKLIFVKAYDEAYSELAKSLSVQDMASNPLLILRFIELGVKLKHGQNTSNILSKTSPLRSPKLTDISGILLKQHSDLNGVQPSIEEIQNHIKTFGPSALSYYAIAFAYECLGNHERAIFNYELSIKEDPEWYPSYFGLSQQYYAKNQDVIGDYYFYLSEKHAPYNLYGNFETHRNLCQFFINLEKYDYARTAISTLSEWWLDNKGKCPVEVKLYEQFALARIAKLDNNTSLAEEELDQAKILAGLMAKDETVGDSALYFAGKVSEEFGEFELALTLYQRVISQTKNFTIIQKLIIHLLDLGEFSNACQYMKEAYNNQPHSKDIEFLMLLVELRTAKVDVDEYLSLREKTLDLAQNGGSKGELLSHANSLLIQFDRDPRVHALVGDIYNSYSQPQRAGFHYEKMYELESSDASNSIKWASWLLSQNRIQESVEVLAKVDLDKFPESREEVLWAQANIHLQANQKLDALAVLSNLLANDTWNVSYNVQYALILQGQAGLERDVVLEKLSLDNQDSFNSQEFSRYTAAIDADRFSDLIYLRSKINYLHSNGSSEALDLVVSSGAKYDAKKATHDLLKLLNTNFDSVEIYFALADLYKSIWQLEASSIWLEQALQAANLSQSLKKRAWTELADCFLWQEINLEKALEYAKSGHQGESFPHAALVIVHAYMKLGRIKEARSYLQQLPPSDPEVMYFSGLLAYRNGDKQAANAIWKPLVSMRIDTMRMHCIKREVLKFYFEEAPYLKAN